MRGLTCLVTLCVKELVVIARDRQAAALLLGMPAVFVLLLSLALEDIYKNMVGTEMPVVLEVEDDGEFGTRIEELLRERGNFSFVDRPADADDSELFRTGAVRAVIRIPAGFTERATEFLTGGTTAGDDGLGDARIAWQASPTLDASYRWFLEAQLGIVCMGLVQEELASAHEETGRDLERLGAEYRATAEKLEHVAAQLQGAVGQLESMQALMANSPDELEAVGMAALAESAAREESRAARAELKASGDATSDDGADSSDEVSADGQPESPAVVLVPLFTGGGATSGAAWRDAHEGDMGPPDWLEELEERQTRGARMADMRAESPANAALFLRQSGGDRNAFPTPLQQTVPGWSLFAMFFIVVPLAQGLHRERSEGTLKRMLTLGVPRPAIVLGKLLPYVFVGVIQFAGMMAVGLYIVPLIGEQTLEFGDKPAVLIPITLVCSLAATSYALMVASLCRTPEQASAFGATSVVILAALGGVMVPHFVMPAILQKAALASPLYWGHQAYLDAFLHGAGLPEVSQALFVLLGFAAVCMAIAARRVAR